MLLEIYILIFIMGLGSLALAVWRGHILASIYSIIMFAVAALSSFSIEYVTAGTKLSIQEPSLLYINLIFMILSVAVTLYGAVKGFTNPEIHAL